MFLRAVLIATELAHIGHQKPNLDPMSPSAVSVAISHQRVSDLMKTLPADEQGWINNRIQMKLNGEHGYTQEATKRLINNISYTVSQTAQS
jgi:hypothetical protein